MNSYPHFINLLRYDLLKLYETGTGTGTGASLPLIRQSGMKKTSLSLSLSLSLYVYLCGANINKHVLPVAVRIDSPRNLAQDLESNSTCQKIYSEPVLGERIRKSKVDIEGKHPNLFPTREKENRMGKIFSLYVCGRYRLLD